MRGLATRARAVIGIGHGDVPPALWWLSLAMIIQSVGFAFVWPFITIYVHMSLHRSLADAGIALLFYSGASVVGSWAGGLLYDAVGGRKVLLWSLAVSTVLFALLASGGSFGRLVLLLSLSGIATGFQWPIMNAWAGSVWPEGGRSAFNFLYVARNLGVAVGTLIGGLIAAVSLHLAFLAAALFYLGYLAIAAVHFRGGAFEARLVRRTGHSSTRLRLSTPLIILSLAFALGSLAYTQMQSIMPTFMTSEGYSLPEYSLLWTLNGILIVVGQPLVTWTVRLVRDIRHQILIGSALMALSFVVLSATVLYVGYLGAMTLATFGEMLVWPGVPAIADLLAPPGGRGRYQGIVSAAQSLGRMVGPLLGGLVAARMSRSSYYLAMTAFFIAALIFFAFVRTRPAAEQEEGLGAVP